MIGFFKKHVHAVAIPWTRNFNKALGEADKARTESFYPSLICNLSCTVRYMTWTWSESLNKWDL